MKITLEKITPKIAEKYLSEANINNRKIRQSYVSVLANEMAQGRFYLTGQGISFFEDGTLADGQHRLSAIVESGQTIEIPVARGVKREAMSAYDIGAKRTVADYLHLHHGLKDANLSTAAVKSIVSFNFSHQNYNLPAEVCLKVLERFGKEIASTIEDVRNFKPTRKAWVVGCLAFARKNFPKEIGDFSHALNSGELIVKGDPAFTCRNWLIEGSSYALKAVYKRAAVEALFNIMHKAVKGETVTMARPGINGINFFASHERKFIEEVRADISHML
jgi:hypothetical protein